MAEPWKPPTYSNVFQFLDDVRKRPSMYFTSLDNLAAILWGYETALWVHGLDEDAPSMGRPFSDFVRYQRPRWSMSLGWAWAFRHYTRTEEGALRLFFDFVDIYRALRPTVRTRVRLAARHQATGARTVIGFGRRLASPKVIELVHYAPAPLFYLRSRYPKPHKSDLHGPFKSMREAQKWAQDEFNVLRSEWDPSDFRR